MACLRRTCTLSGLSLVAALGLPSTAGAVPLVDLSINALDPQACGGSGCWTNHLRVTDLDGDGDLDILLVNYGDFFSGNNNAQPLVLYVNDGAAGFTNNSAAALGNYVGALRMVAVGDVDGDGAVDIYAPAGNGDAHVLFINDGSGVFIDEADVRLPNDYPRGAATRMGDVDGDGDLDIFAADGYATNGPPFGHLYINDGTGSFTEAMAAIPDMIMGQDIDDVELVDVDRDFDLDLIVNAHGGGTGALWLNDGSGSFAAGGTLPSPGPGSNYHYNVAPCDVDNDGDLDLWIDNTGGNYSEQLLINDGAGNFSDETNARVTGNGGADDNGVACADVDDDGDLDAIVLSLAGPERLFENDGSGNFTFVQGGFPAPGDCTLWGEFGDLDADGRLDLVTGQGECSSSDEVYLGNADMAVDTTAPTIVAEDIPMSAPVDTPIVVRFAIADGSVSDEGPRLARAYVVVDPNGDLDAHYIGGDLYRVEIPGNTNSILVQACAEDLAGNVGCGSTQAVQIGDGGDGDGDGDPGDGDGDGDGGPGDGDGDPGDGDGDGGTDTDISETGTDTAAGDESGDGCSCSQRPPAPNLAWTGLLLLGFGLVRRRRA